MTTDVPDSAAKAADPEQPAPVTPATPARSYVAVQESDEFVGLRRTLRRFIFPMTVAFFLWYSLYVLLSAYARDFMGIKIVGNINVALVFGLLQFLSTFLIAWAYSRYADRNVDPVAQKIKAELDAEEVR
jgi:uncharacterized membrane protein (DUF485 family)